MDLKIYTLAKKPATVTQQLQKSIDFRRIELYDFHLRSFKDTVYTAPPHNTQRPNSKSLIGGIKSTLQHYYYFGTFS